MPIECLRALFVLGRIETWKYCSGGILNKSHARLQSQKMQSRKSHIKLFHFGKQLSILAESLGMVFTMRKRIVSCAVVCAALRIEIMQIKLVHTVSKSQTRRTLSPIVRICTWNCFTYIVVDNANLDQI